MHRNGFDILANADVRRHNVPRKTSKILVDVCFIMLLDSLRFYEMIVHQQDGIVIGVLIEGLHQLNLERTPNKLTLTNSLPSLHLNEKVSTDSVQ